VKVSVIGTGYVGLVSGVCLAAKGHEVTCVDIDQEKIARINSGEAPIHERGLDDMLHEHIGRTLRATTDLESAILGTEMSLIAVGTPFDGDEIDLSFVKDVAEKLGEVLRQKSGYHVVVVKSTVVPGTTDSVVKPLLEQASGKQAGRDFGLGMNPEFLREGEAVQDFMEPDRIVLGGIDTRTIDAMAELYSVFPGVDNVRTNTRTAEMIKYTANSLLATMISFSNEVANLSTAVGDIDIVDVMQGVHLDRRLSPILENGQRVAPSFTTYLEAGCGFGGSCFPKDVKALISHGKSAGLPMALLDAVIRVNSEQPGEVIRLIERHYPSLDGIRVALLGLAFKPNTDDMRESPAIPVAEMLSNAGATICAYDPVARHEAERVLARCKVSYEDSLQDVIEGADVVVLLTRWPEFDQLPELISQLASQPLVVDGRRMLAKDRIPRYEGIGLRDPATSRI